MRLQMIYTKSLEPMQAVLWSRLMNFFGVLIGPIAVAYALVELLRQKCCRRRTADPAACLRHSHRNFRIFGTLVTSGAGLRYGMISRIFMPWLFTLTVTVMISARTHFCLADPRFHGWK